METITMETPSASLFSAPDHISSFLEDFQDKNAHLFPSNDLSFEGTESTDNDASSLNTCGSKRKRDCLYDSFSGWTEDLLSSETFESSPTIDSTVVSDGIIDNSDGASKKRKLEDDEELSIFISDARSRSPPFQPLDFDLESVPTENVLAPPKSSTPPTVAPDNSVTAALNIISRTNPSIRASMFESLNRLAENAEKGKSTVSFSPNASPLHQVMASQDYLTMQTMFGMAMRPPTTQIVKAENRSYYPVTATAAGIPFVMNNSYMMSKCVDASTLAAYKQSLTNVNNLYSNTCSKNMVYPQGAFLAPQPSFTQATIVQPQNLYSQTSNLHVL